MVCLEGERLNMAREWRDFRFDLEWRTTLLTAVLLPLLVFLGFWQLERAQEKALLASAFNERQSKPPAPLTTDIAAGPRETLAYLPVRARGQFLVGRDILLDNRIHRGQFGYEVVSPLLLDRVEEVVLVNRGWIAGDSSRRTLPEIPSVAGPVDVTGHLYIAPGSPYLLAEQVIGEAWPKVVQVLEIEKLRPAVEAAASKPLFPHVVRLDSGQSGALTIDWQVVNVSPEKHTGYAVQWFVMAFALLVLFLLRSSNLWPWLTGNTRNED